MCHHDQCPPLCTFLSSLLGPKAKSAVWMWMVRKLRWRQITVKWVATLRSYSDAAAILDLVILDSVGLFNLQEKGTNHEIGLHSGAGGRKGTRSRFNILKWVFVWHPITSQCSTSNRKWNALSRNPEATLFGLAVSEWPSNNEMRFGLHDRVIPALPEYPKRISSDQTIHLYLTEVWVTSAM